MPSPLRLSALAALFALVAACDSSDRGLSEDLQRDLGEVRASSVELAPRVSDVREVVSAEEQFPSARVARAATPVTRPRPATQPTVREAAAPPAAERSTEVAQAPEPQPPAAQSAGGADTASVASTPRPRPTAPASGRRGGYKTVGEIIRDAPFPINP
jgi:hypothetical protein